MPTVLPARARAQREVRDRRDARQRLAAEPERARSRRDRRRARSCWSRAARSPAARRPASIPSPSSSTRISFLPPSSTAIADAAGAGVERVLDQLLDDRGRPLDDFAGGDLVGEVGREPVDAGHGLDPAAPAEVPPAWSRRWPIMTPISHQNMRASPPTPKCGRSTFMPHMPVRTVSGMKIVDDDGQHLHDLFSWFETIDRCASSMLVIAVLEEHRLVGEAHEVVVDVAEPVGHLLVDLRELAPRQPADDVALRHGPRGAATRRRCLKSRIPSRQLGRGAVERPRSSSSSSRSSSSSISGR